VRECILLTAKDDTNDEGYHPYLQTHLYQVLHNPFMATILLLMYERFNTGSYWKEMISLMPSMEDSILFWSDDELQSLVGSSLDPSYVIMKNKKCAQVYLDCLAPIFKYHADLFPPDMQSIDNFKWALTSLWSRGYMLDDNDEFPGLVPFADMFNHYPSEAKEYVAVYNLDSCTNSFKVIAKRSYDIGDQVFSTYGHKSNDEWLVDYGFVFRNNPVKDVRIKHPSLHPSDAFYKEKLKILSSHGDNVYAAPENKVAKFSYLRIFFFDETEMEQFPNCTTLADVDSCSPFNLGISFRNERMVYEYVLDFMNSITRPKEEREKLKRELEALEACTELPLTDQKRKMCLIFITEEQRALDELVEQYSKQLETIVTECKN